MRRIMTLIAIGACANALAGTADFRAGAGDNSHASRLRDPRRPHRGQPALLGHLCLRRYPKLQFIYSSVIRIKHGDEYRRRGYRSCDDHA